MSLFFSFDVGDVGSDVDAFAAFVDHVDDDVDPSQTQAQPSDMSDMSDSDDDRVDMEEEFINLLNVDIAQLADPAQLFDSGESDDDEEFFGFDDDHPPYPTPTNWKKEEKASEDRFNFVEQPGPTFQEPPNEGLAIDYFQLFFDDDFLEKVKIWTNKNHALKMMRYADKNKGPWVDIETVAELKLFIGILLFIEQYLACRMEDIWSTQRKHSMMSFPGIAKLMSRDRFYAIKRYLHFCDEEIPRARRQKLSKVKSLLLHMQKSFRDCYVPKQNLSLDECMVPYKGRLGMKQYNKEKPTKWGIKLWMLAESESAYCYNFEVYVGKKNEEDRRPTLGLATRVVLELCQPLNKGYRIFIDRFYSSPLCCFLMAKRGFSVCGTVMPSRKSFPNKELSRHPRDMNPGDSDWLIDQNTGTLATVWMDKRIVYYCCNMHTPNHDDDECTVIRHDKRGNEVITPATPCVVD